ncbi:MAG TPA: GDSL-type esterase/lipase family protein [Acidimicrobiia bacterium]|nr:GDSL-type esterase/lipase family protein [Acidimicrobiia bacterium]
MTSGGESAAVSPEPFLRGNAWPGTEEVPYPRADPADFDRLPGDTVGTARLPVGVRLEFVGAAETLEVDYETHTDDLGYRGDGAGTAFTLLSGEESLSIPADLGAGTAHFPLAQLDRNDPDRPVIVYLPEGMRPRLFALRIGGGALAPAPRGPRWLAYGDSIAEGWIATGPSGAWPAVAARRTGLDVVNLGYAGSARGELPSAQQIAALDADVISVSHGTNCWSRIPFSTAMFREQTRAFLALVRAGHPETPIVVTSPIVRPDAEETPNALGATLVDLRTAMEELTRELIAAGDAHLMLVEGGGLIGADDLPDGIHPGDHGHEVLADVFGGAVASSVT